MQTNRSRKWKILWSAIIVCLVVLLFSAWILQGYKRNKEVMSRCTDYADYNILILDCYGVLSIQNSREMNSPDYELFDHKHRYTVAYINTPTQFTVRREYLYAIDHKPGSSFDALTGKYGVEFVLQSGEMGELQYDKPDQVPVYLKIATKTGIVTPYQTYDQMPGTDRAIFQELDAKSKK